MKSKLLLFLLFFTFLFNQIIASSPKERLGTARLVIGISGNEDLADSINKSKKTRKTFKLKASLAPPSVIAGSSCGDGVNFVQVNVYANGTSIDEQIEWYASQNSSSPLYTGFVYSPSINSTKTYYAQSKSRSTGEVSIRVPVVASVYLVPSSVSISVSPVNSPTNLLCPNTPITFTANGGGDLFEFSIEGVVVQGMSANRSYISSSLLNGQTVSVRSRFTKVLDGSMTESAWGTGPIEDNVLSSPLSTNAATAYINSIKISPEENNLVVGISGKIDKNSSILLFLDSKFGGFSTSNYGDVLAASNIRGFNFFNNNPSNFDSYFQADYCLVISTDAAESSYFADIIELRSGESIRTSLGNASSGSPSALLGVDKNNLGSSDYNLGFEIQILKSLIGYTTGDVKFFGFTMKDNDVASYGVTNSFLSPDISTTIDYGNLAIDYNVRDPNPVVFSSSGLIPCYSNDFFTINLYEQPSVSSVTQPTCASPFGVISIGIQNGAEYSIDGTTYQTSNVFAGLVEDSYTLYIRRASDKTCEISSSSPVLIVAVPTAPMAPLVDSVTQPNCTTPSGTIIIASQIGVEYSLDGEIYQGSNSFSSVITGDYNLYVRNTGDNTCMTMSTSTIGINAVPIAPVAPTTAIIMQPTCSAPSGTITITTQSGVEYSVNGSIYQSSSTFSGLTPNDYSLYVRNTADPSCLAISVSTTSINSIPSPPAAPIAASVTQPTCAVPFGNISVAEQSGVEYSLDGIAYQASNSFSELDADNYTLYVRGIIDNTCVTSSVSITTINEVLMPPAVPKVSSIVQPSCAEPSGTIVVASQLNVDYSLDGSTYQSSSSFAGLAPNNYTVYVRNVADATCVTMSFSPTLINEVTLAPAVPTASDTVQPTCAGPSGTITISAQSGVEYSVNGTTYQSSSTFSGLTPNDYTLYVRNTSDITCVASSLNTVAINPIQIVVVPMSSSIIQPTCAIPLGTIVIATQTGVEYSLNGLIYQVSNTFSGLIPEDYVLYVRSISDNSCANMSSSITTINEVPTPPAVPTIAGVVQPTCEIPSGSIAIETQTGVEYSVDGTSFQASNLFSGLVPKDYTLFVRNIEDKSCFNQSTLEVTIDPLPPLPLVPTVDSIVQLTCFAPTGVIVISTQSDVQYSIGNGYQDSPEFINLLPGTYPISVRFTSSIACISNGAEKTIRPVPPQIQFEIIGDCMSKDYVLTASALGNSYDPNEVTYHWKDNAGLTVGGNSSVFNVSNSIASSSVLEELPLTYTLTITSTPNGCESTNNVVVESIYCNMQKGISPDGNGSNDYFDLKLLDVKNLQLFDRYGVKVYSQSNYTDQWKGQSDKGNELPSATYYYVIEFNNSKIKTGWIYLIREKL